MRPTPRQQRLFCLQDASAVATRLGLPPDLVDRARELGSADHLVGFTNLLNQASQPLSRRHLVIYDQYVH